MEDEEYARVLELVGPARETYGTAEVAASGIDISQLRHNRRLSPEQRVEQMAEMVRALAPLQGILRRRPS